MHRESTVLMELEEKLKPLTNVCEKIQRIIEEEFEKGAECIDTKEMGEVIDMWKDMYEAKEKLIKGCYYKQIMEAMEEAEYEEEHMHEHRMGYRGQPRNSMGRYTSRRGYEHMIPMEYDEELHPHSHSYGRDMDIEDGRMYYTEPNRRMQGDPRRGSSRGSRYGFAYDQYMEKRDKHSKSTPEDSGKRIELLNEFIDDLEEMSKDVLKGMSPEERQIWKIKLNKLTSM